MPLRASSSGYCVAVRKPLHLSTTDATVSLVFALPPLPLVSWRFFLLARRASVPSTVDHCLPQRVPKYSALPAPAAFVDTRPLFADVHLWLAVAGVPPPGLQSNKASGVAALSESVPRAPFIRAVQALTSS